MVERPRRKQRRSARLSEKDYRAIRDKVLGIALEITSYAATFAAARLRRLGVDANRSDLRPGPENAKDIAGELLKKWLSGERQDWNGNPDTLREAIRRCVNSILAGRLTRIDNLRTEPIDDSKLEWLYGDTHRWDPELEPLEERLNRYTLAKLVRRLFPRQGYGLEANILAVVLIHRVFETGAIADIVGVTEKEILESFKRLGAYTLTDEFAMRHSKLFGERASSSPSAFAHSASGLAQSVAIGEAAGVTSWTTVARAVLVQDFAQIAQPHADQMQEVITRISDWAGGKDKAITWYRAQPIPAFGNRTAESLVKSGQASALRDYLDDIAMGGFA